MAGGAITALVFTACALFADSEPRRLTIDVVNATDEPLRVVVLSDVMGAEAPASPVAEYEIGECSQELVSAEVGEHWTVEANDAWADDSLHHTPAQELSIRLTAAPDGTVTVDERSAEEMLAVC